MTQISLDHQIVQKACDHCKQVFTVSRGSVYEDGEPIAIYLAALHACYSSKAVHLVIAMRRGYRELTENTAVALRVRPAETEFQTIIMEPNQSPWQSETYLGKILTREQALASPLIELVFHIADYIVMEIPEVNEYLAG